MKRNKHARIFLLVAALTILSVSQSAYVFRTLSNLVRLRWTVQDYPVHMRAWSGFNESHPSITAGSRPQVALREALERWSRISSMMIRFSTGSPQREMRRDGVNLITIADTPNNNSIIGEYFLGVSQTWQEGSRIVETDILFNPRQSWSTREQAKGWNLLQTAMHEFGHSAGLGHSINRSSAMYYQGGLFNYAFNRLAWDDIAGLNSSYRLTGMDLITGDVEGRVVMGSQSVFGAVVVAVDNEGVLMASALTGHDGSYRLECLPPGAYTLYAEPLDGPTTPDNLASGHLSTAAMNTNFRPQFYRNSTQPLLRVAAGQTTRADFQVTSGRSQLDPEWVKADADPYQNGFFSSMSVFTPRDRTVHFAMAGKGVSLLDEQSSVGFLGPHIDPGPLSRSATNANGVHFRWYQQEVSEDAPRGSYSAVVRSGGETGVITGALEVASPYRYATGFAQFAHLDGAARSEVFLINRQLDAPVNGRIYGLDQNGLGEGFQLAQQRGGESMVGLSVPAAGSVALQSQSDAGFVGSLRAEADSNFFGTVLIETPVGTTSIMPSRPLYSFVAPIDLSTSSGVNTGLALTNFERRPAQIWVEARDQHGGFVSSNIVDLEERGQLSNYVGELVPGLPDEFQGAILVTANREIGATVIRTGTGSFTTYPVIENRVTGTAYFAQFAQSGDLHSELLLVNPSPLKHAQNVEVVLRAYDGRPGDLEINGRPLSQGRTYVAIPPLGSVRLRTTGSRAFVGSVEVNSEVPVGGVVLFRSPLLGTTGVGESLPLRKMVLPLDRNLETGLDTGLAVVNTEDRPVSLSVSVRAMNGDLVRGPVSLELQPRQQLARFPDDEPLNLELGDLFRGTLWVEADGQVAMTVIRQSPGVLTTLPAIGLGETFGAGQ